MANSSQHDSLPLTKEVLGEHLFSKIEASNPENADRITGMLLEAGNERVMAMLEDDNLLNTCVRSALQVIHRESQNRNAADKQVLGEDLYSLVQALHPNQCPAKITGMLMELDSGTIQSLLDSPADLQKAVNKAVCSLNAEQTSRPGTEDDDDAIEEERQDIGEELFQLVAQQKPDLAPKITGMLLEMDIHDLKALLKRQDLLQEKIQLACQAIQEDHTRGTAVS